ncbi:MAG: CDP-alcohol phosphatidyltransferase family protein [Planctomycetota bacterium]|jgi:CDP-diacylglycerol--serine O-phosphatidyltransferase
MPRSKSQAAKDKLLRRMRRQRLKYITILPSLITILNGVCGFAAIVLAGKGVSAHVGNFSALAVAGYLILLAMFADMLDGRLARMSHSTSSFGAVPPASVDSSTASVTSSASEWRRHS